MSSVPFRLSPCDNPSEASQDAVTFGDPNIYAHLSGLGRIKIEADSPLARAGTVWYRIDREYCCIEAAVIRPNRYPLAYKVLAEMLAAQLGFSFVGRYGSMNYGYATRSLIWDDVNIPENAAHVYCSPYPAMIPIVKATVIIGSDRKPVIVRRCQNATEALADAATFGDADFINKLSNLARLEVVAGADGTRAGTIWYYRNGNYCFVVASYLRSTAPQGTERYLPILASQFFGYRYVGTYSGIPHDISDLALAWDRSTGTPIPELSPLSERLSGTQDFVLTFDDVTPDPSVPPVPEPDPYPQTNPGDGGDTGYGNCDSETLHLNQAGWSYDGCLWYHSDSPGESYYWEPTSDGKGGSWLPMPYGTEITRDPGSPIYVNPGNGMVQIGWNVTVTYADGNGGTYNDNVSDYSEWPNGTFIQGYYDYNYYADGQGSYYSEYTGSSENYPSAGTEISRENLDPIGIYSPNGNYYQVGYRVRVTYADGNGGSYTTDINDYSGWPNGQFLFNENQYNYYTDGMGGYYQGEYTGSNGDSGGAGYPAAGTVVSTDYLDHPSIYWEGFGQNGNFVFCDYAYRDWHADGSGGTYWDGGYYNMTNEAAEGAVIWDGGTQQVYFTGGSGGNWPSYFLSN